MMGPKPRLPTIIQLESKLEEGWRARLLRSKSGEALLSPQLIMSLETLIMEGNTRQNAARLCGVRGSTIAMWIRHGCLDIEAGTRTLNSDLVWALERAEGEQERLLAWSAWRTATGIAGDGKLALSLLERRNPADWAPASPESQDPASRFAGLSKPALQAEITRILTTSKEVDGEVVPPKGPDEPQKQ